METKVVAFTDETQKTLEENVARGIQLLSEHEPGWRTRINLDILDIWDCNACVLGQLYDDGSANWEFFPSNPFEIETPEQGEVYGFSLPKAFADEDGDYDDEKLWHTCRDTLNALWKQAILQREGVNE